MNKKSLLLFCLALNSVTGYSDNNTTLDKKYEKIYENMTNNIKNGKSNESAYKLIEKILNKRNLELKDLYLQSDYIVKPEFLEWQVFFSSFYNNSHRGGNKENINIRESGEAKNIDLGLVVPLKGISRNQIDLNLTPVSAPVININIPEIVINEPATIAFNPVIFTVPTLPQIYGPGFSSPTASSSPGTGTVTNLTAYNTTGSKIYENLNIDSPNGTSITWNGSPSSTLTMSGATSYVNGGVSGNTGGTVNHTGQASTLSINNIGINGDYNITGNWTLNMNATQYNNFAFVSYKPNYITTNSSVTNNGTIILNDLTTNNYGNILVGMGLDLTNPSATGQPVARLENKGNILIYLNNNAYYPRGIGMQLESIFSNSTISGELINSGKITVDNAPGSTFPANHKITGILINGGSFSPTANVKIGNIDLLGQGSFGVEVGGSFGSALPNVTIDGSGGVINIFGMYSRGVLVGVPLGQAASSNLIENIRNLNMNLNAQYGSGLTINLVGSPVILNDQIIQSMIVGPNSSGGSLIQNSGSNMTIDSSLANAISNNAGSNNIVLLNVSGTLINNMPISIGSGTKNGIGILNGFTSTSTSTTNYGDITINSTPDASTFYSSIGLDNNIGTLRNFGNITANSNSSVALYGQKGNLISNTGNITVNGNNSEGIFSTANGTTLANRATISIESGNITLNGERGALVYLYGGFASLGSAGNTVTGTVNGGNSFLFYSTPDYNNNVGTVTINGNVNAQVRNGAIGFYYAGTSTANPPVDLSAYLAGLISINSGVLNVDIDANSYLFGITKTAVNLSSLNNIHLTGMNLTGSEKILVNNSLLTLDIDSNLDYLNNTGNKQYRDLGISYSSVTINPGITVSGTEDNQVGIAQVSSYPPVSLINNGIISLTGENAIGIYGQNATLINNGTINLGSSINGTGLYTDASFFGSGTSTNNAVINMGQDGIGIYGKTNDYAVITLNNFGIITGTGNNSSGIYINNVGNSATANLTLSSASNIDVKNSLNGIGIYTNNTDIGGTGAGTITVGQNGVGVYAKNGTTTLNNLTLNLFGNNSVGIYTDGTNSFTGNGTINVDGTGVIIFNISGTGSFNQNFTITSTPGSSYAFGNIKNTTIYSNNSTTMGANGIYINGTNSAVLLGTNSSLTSLDSNVTGLALNGGYIGGLPVTINSQALNQEATNQGNISFGNNSTGIYVINGASAENQGTITLGDGSAGIYGNGAGSNVSNTGTITTGGASAGMYLKDGDTMTNSGNIYGTQERTVGLYLEGITTSTVTNNGVIDLSGDKTLGIYTTGNGVQTINNTGTIIVGYSSTELDPSVGIYNESDNNIINNSGNITTGMDSIGIYNVGGTVNQIGGGLNIGAGGIGIYTDSGSVNLSGGTVNSNGADTVGIYAINGAAIDNNASLNISDNSFGIVLNSGANLVNRNLSTLGNGGVAIYSDGGASITNELGADITITGSK